MRLHHPRISLLIGLALLGCFSVAGGDEPTDDHSPSLTDQLHELVPETPVSGVSFLTSKAKLWLGRSQIICFYAQEPPNEDRQFSFNSDEEYLQVLIPPTLKPGRHVGYIRVKPLQVGRTEISLEGESMQIDIEKDDAASTLEVTRPEIVSPAQGAVVWGKFTVGVEQLNLSSARPEAPPVLRLPDGTELDAKRVPDQQPGPHLRYAFTIDADTLTPGSNDLVAVFKDAAGEAITSNPLEVVALKPDDSAIIAGNCRDQVNARASPKTTTTTGKHADEKSDTPRVVQDDQSAYGEIVYCPYEDSAWSLPVNIPAKGIYQMILTTRGDPGDNALPSVGLGIDDATKPVTTARLATTTWQRLPVGHPFTLDAGHHILSVRFRNAYGNGSGDSRRLYLARYELARLDQLPAGMLAIDSSANTTMQDTAATPFNERSQSTPNAMQQPDPMAGALAPYGSLHVVFEDALDGQVIANKVRVGALAWWPDRSHAPPPKTDLLINDQVAASETTAHPVYDIDVSAFHPGANKLQLRATLASGQEARSVVENLTLPSWAGRGPGLYLLHYVFDIYDPAWQGSLAAHVHSEAGPDAVAELSGNEEATLHLPDDLRGAYKIAIEAHGDGSNGPPVGTLFLRTGGQDTKLSDISAGEAVNVFPAGQIELPTGPKSIIVKLAASTQAAGQGDRHLFVRSVRLDPIVAPDKSSPVVTIDYPPSNAEVGLADAVVAKVFGRQGVVHADLLLDDEPQKLNLTAKNGLGPVVFPLLTRGLAAGPHKIQVVATDESGNSTRSGEVTINVTGKGAAPGSAYARALILLNRFAYGPEPAELAKILTVGPHEWLAARLNETIDSPIERNEEERLHAGLPDVNAVVTRSVQGLLTNPNPVRARFLVWAENHFSTWVNKDGPAEKSREHDRFFEIGVAPFPDLLLASAMSPAMLIYLDQRDSVAKKLNENYAREIMELHTLGVNGGYTQKDVTSLAQLLTGWTVADEAPRDGSSELERTFRYDPYLNDGEPVEVLGMEFGSAPPEERFDRVLTALNLLAGHPSCAFFISRKIAEHYVADPAPPGVVNRLARVYLESGGDMRAMLLSLADAPDLATIPPKVASPIDFAVRLARLAGMHDPEAVSDFATRSGMGMFDRATPDGYPDNDGYFTNSNALLQRWRFAIVVQASFLGHGLIPDDWRPDDGGWDPLTTQRLVDLVAVRLTGNVLSDASNEAALKLVASAPENTDARLHLLTAFLCQIPETSLR